MTRTDTPGPSRWRCIERRRSSDSPYLEGRHHPQLALPERVAFLAELRGAPSGVATALLVELARWFARHGAHRICVDVNAESPGADAFYVEHRAERLQPHWRVWPDIRALLP